ncbi:TIGR03668 family PPOX class F420-dependent oxidoreductase [Haloechinothrix sp. YIM 98757]|uniref:TIGR03668 family PPOX class F420-dependent oxidoreductase n=1 Tax=Haloechinothrix aidingensis TaxID=2752311 RepID=A0A838A9P0_9PSEU|nr:TIGR03668 family PPOX class F420-dependent oxidoreductase [Haloechinothrix aidingensis]MBA0125877.1 TIGR03668 family PPOX class F420-dependent oxidoreductase [Haloechinothrix aidingensis]
MRLSDEQARERFRRSRVARLATADAEAVPHVVPVTFALAGGRLCFAVDHKPKSTTMLRRLRNIDQNPPVSLLVDHYDEDWTYLWWARADGTATVLPAGTASAARDESVRALCEKYGQYAGRTPQGPVVRIDVSRWSGWCASSHAAT